MNIFDPELIVESKPPQSPVIVDIKVNNKKLQSGHICHLTGASNPSEIKSLVLPFEENTISFQFSAMDYSDPDASSFRYELSKKNDRSPNVGHEDQVTFFDLKAGRYNLKIYSINSEGLESSEPKEFHLTIRPHWSQTWWFLSIVAIIIAGILYAIYRNRVEHLRKRQQIAESKMLLAETENAVLRTQMNPHFIFNSLNSIRSYILDKDTRTADDYLVDSTTFMRKIMEIAPKHSITLGQEIDLLKAYMDLEKKRFDGGFEHEIIHNLDTDDYVLPTMLLQPFVENAIIHGFHRKEGNKKIEIRFWIEDEKLFSSVRDNGVGRKVRASAIKEHKSKALEITHSRLKIIEEKTQTKTSLDIIDHEDKHGKSLGTEVIVSIPFL